MLLANKIKESQECIENKAVGFRTFLESLREARPLVSFPRRPSQSIHESQPLPDHEHPSEPNRSEIHLDRSERDLERPFTNLSSGFADRVAEGDKAIRNKLRVGVANRQRANCFRLPAYCFEPTRQDLGDHLKEVKKDIPKGVIDVVNKRGQAQREQQFAELLQQKSLNGEDRPRKISALNPTLVLKYCSIHQISNASSLKEVLVFFTRLLDLLSFSLAEPKIEKYKNCVYFGQPIRKNQIYEGIIYYYSGVVYFGELFNSQRHGMGVEIDISKGSIHKGEFRDGDLVGFCEVKQDHQKYYGELNDGKYHGRGKLISSQEVFEGQFRGGRKLYGSTNKQSVKKDLNSSRGERRQTPFWSGEKELNSSRSEHFQFSKNKIRPINLYRSSNAQFESNSERKKQNKRYVEESREFSYPLNHEMEGSFNPQISDMINSKRNSRVSSLRIREVGKLHSTRKPQPEEDEERPLMNKF